MFQKPVEHEAIILLVDDDPGDQELTRRALAEGALKTRLHMVNNGEEAMQYLTRKGRYENAETSPKPDLILLDLNMPRMDGKAVLAQLQKHPELDSIPVVVLTTSQQEEDILRSYSLGCNSFITKPVELDKFIRAVQGVGHYWFRLVTLPAKAA